MDSQEAPEVLVIVDVMLVAGVYENVAPLIISKAGGAVNDNGVVVPVIDIGSV